MIKYRDRKKSKNASDRTEKASFKRLNAIG
jgi:hypothetical protein